MSWAGACHTVGPAQCAAVPSAWNVLVSGGNLFLQHGGAALDAEGAGHNRQPNIKYNLYWLEYHQYDVVILYFHVI